MNTTNYEVPQCEAFSTPHSHVFLAPIIRSGSCSQIRLGYVTVLYTRCDHIFSASSVLILKHSHLSNSPPRSGPHSRLQAGLTSTYQKIKVDHRPASKAATSDQRRLV